MIFEKIKNSLQKAESVKCYGSLNSGNLMIPLADAISIVEQAEVEYNNGWIPCGERLPKVNGWYLVTNELGVVQQQYRSANHWQKLRDDAVIAWQPLPEPYTKGE